MSYKTLIIGSGEIGSSLKRVLENVHETHIRDRENLDLKGVEVLNICYPPSKDFVEITKRYIKQYKPKVTIIHSTVPVGTTDQCGESVVHSPVHGKHPNISEGLLTYTKYLGGQKASAVLMATDFLEKAGIKVKIVANAKTSELSKILCTTYYGWNIVFMKEVLKMCEQYGVPFDEVYTNWNLLYNEGMEKLGKKYFVRPVLEPMSGKIGGHCVVQNCHLLKSNITDFIIRKNEEY